MHFVVAIFMVTVGLVAIVYNLYFTLKSDRALSWPNTAGKVIDSRLKEVKDGDGSTYKAHILYEYSVNGVTLRSDVWRIGAIGSSSFTVGAKAAVARYPVGASVVVYFNPEKHSDATLEPGKKTWGLFCWGALFLIFGAIFYFSRSGQH